MPTRKILCLHGAGTNAKIWEAQTTGIRHHLPPDWEWVFIDGDETCEPAEGIQEIYGGPYRAFYTLPTLENIKECGIFLDEIIEDEGPFDIVMGFSQGGALAASYLLHRQQDHPHDAPSFPLAVFINASLPYSQTTACGLDMTHLFSSLGNTSATWKSITPDDDGNSSAATNPGNPLCTAVQQQQQQQIYRWHPAKDVDTRLQIPTVHVYGARDPYMPQGLLLKELCATEMVFSYQHRGDHAVPRDPRTCKEIAEVILAAQARVELRQ